MQGPESGVPASHVYQIEVFLLTQVESSRAHSFLDPPLPTVTKPPSRASSWRLSIASWVWLPHRVLLSGLHRPFVVPEDQRALEPGCTLLTVTNKSY